MSSRVKLSIDLKLFECPFFLSCTLPKIQFLCKFPECKNCPDYVAKLQRMRK